MPNACSLYIHLESRLVELSEKFLNDQIAAENADPIRFEPDRDRLAAFRLLMHAEIEDFLERKAKQNLTAIASYIDDQKSLSAFPELFSIALALDRPPTNRDFFDLQAFKCEVLGIIKSAKTKITKNNGIKQESFNFLSVFAGKSIDEIDSTLSASLNSYGKNRGEVAHQSASRVASIDAPSSEFHSAQALVSALGVYFQNMHTS